MRWANPAFCRAVERERAALVGRPVGAAVPAAVAVGALELLDWVYRTGEGASLADQPYVDAAPTHLPWLAAVWPVPDDRGRAVGLVLQGGPRPGPAPRDEQAVAEVRAITERVLIAGLVAMAVTSLVPYARAKAEALGYTVAGGPGERAERAVFISAGLILHVEEGAMWVLTALCLFTFLTRCLSVYRQATAA